MESASSIVRSVVTIVSSENVLVQHDAFASEFCALQQRCDLDMITELVRFNERKLVRTSGLRSASTNP